MSKRSRDKGLRIERALVHTLQNVGLAGERVPLSGAARGRFGGDVSVPLLGVDRRVEVKARANGFKRLYDWLSDYDFLVIKADRLEPLVVLRLTFGAEIAALAERARIQQPTPKMNSRTAGNAPETTSDITSNEEH